MQPFAVEPRALTPAVDNLGVEILLIEMQDSKTRLPINRIAVYVSELRAVDLANEARFNPESRAVQVCPRPSLQFVGVARYEIGA